jgi:hypothetical protein
MFPSCVSRAKRSVNSVPGAHSCHVSFGALLKARLDDEADRVVPSSGNRSGRDETRSMEVTPVAEVRSIRSLEGGLLMIDEMGIRRTNSNEGVAAFLLVPATANKVYFVAPVELLHSRITLQIIFCML